MKRLSNLFRTADGKNYAFIFMLACTLFLLWGTCSGMIDVLNKHFQNSLKVTKAQSALVQFAYYMGYFLMAVPSGLLARRFGYKGGILIGLGLIASGAFLFIPATMINTFWAFLTGLFILATGLTCLETIANPYTTVLGPPEMGPTRINLAQSCNGIGWMIGPMLGGYFVLSATAEVNTSNESLYKPYLLVALVVTILFIFFARAHVPDLHAEEESKARNSDAGTNSGKPLFKRWHFVLAVAAQFFYVAAQTGIFSFFINYAGSDMPSISQGVAETLNGLPSRLRVSSYPAAMLSPGELIGDLKRHPALTTNVSELIAKLKNDPDPRTQPVSQFLWSQFSKKSQKFLSYPVLNEVVSGQENSRDLQSMVDEIDASNFKEKQAMLVNELNRILEQNPGLRLDDLQNPTALVNRLKTTPDALSTYLAGQFSEQTRKQLQEYQPAQPPSNGLQLVVVAELNNIMRKENIYAPERFAQIKLNAETIAQAQQKLKREELVKVNRALLEQAYPGEIAKTEKLYDAKRFAGVALAAETRSLIEKQPEGETMVRLNRRLLEDAYPEKYIARSPALQAPLFRVSERGASVLLSIGGFGLFLLGRFSGSMVLSVFKAHSTLALYGLINTIMMVLVILPLQWVSVAGLFLSFFFMSIMFPTIFALGIRGLGEHTKMGSSLIVMAIVGGAIMPIFMGWLADIASMRIGFLMPLICFVFIFAYGAAWRLLEEKDIGKKAVEEVAAA